VYEWPSSSEVAKAILLHVSVIIAVSCHGGESYHQLQGLSKNGRRISIENKAEKREIYSKINRPP